MAPVCHKWIHFGAPLNPLTFVLFWRSLLRTRRRTSEPSKARFFLYGLRNRAILLVCSRMTSQPAQQYSEQGICFNPRNLM